MLLQRYSVIIAVIIQEVETGMSTIADMVACSINTNFPCFQQPWTTLLPHHRWTILLKQCSTILLKQYWTTLSVQQCCFIIAEQYCWNNAEQYCWNNDEQYCWNNTEQHCRSNNVVSSSVNNIVETMLNIIVETMLNNIVETVLSNIVGPTILNNIVGPTMLFTHDNNVVQTLFRQQPWKQLGRILPDTYFYILLGSFVSHISEYRKRRQEFNKGT